MAGFSLYECLTVLLFVAILALLPISQNAWLHHTQAQMLIDQLVRDLQFARQQALTRHSIITVCPSRDGLQCHLAEDWTKGYLIFADPSGKGMYADNTEHLLHTSLSHAGLLSNSRDRIQFSPNGFTRGHNSSFHYILDSIEHKVILNLQGRIRVE